MKQVLIALAVFFLLSYSQIGFAQKPNLPIDQNEFTISGIMQHTDIEGGCWFLASKKVKYELTGTPEILNTCRVEGRMLVLRVRPRALMASTCMLGHVVEVTEVLDTVMHPHNPPFEHRIVKGVIHMSPDSCWYVKTKSNKRYELQNPIPQKFMHVGAKYHRMSTILPRSESLCNMDYVITISMLDPDLKSDAKQKKFDPR
jgi:hypothetical protein